MSRLRIGIVQLEPKNNPRDSLKTVENILSRYAMNPDLIVIPEYAQGDPHIVNPKSIAESLEEPGPWLQGLSRIALEYSTYIIAGFYESHGSDVYDSAVLVDPSGDFKGIYRKIHLFDAYGFRESSIFKPGDELPPIVDIKGFKIGIEICFDIRFPELTRILALKGAEVIVIPSAWYAGPLKEETLVVLARARAIENTVYVVVSGLSGSRFTGRSLVVDPLGVVMLDLGFGEKYGEAILEKDTILEARKTIPLLRLRRPNLYGELLLNSMD